MIRLTDAGWLTSSGRTTVSCGGSSISLPAAALAEVTSDSHQQSRLHDSTDQERRLWEQALQLRRFIARATDVRLIRPRAASEGSQELKNSPTVDPKERTTAPVKQKRVRAVDINRSVLSY
ncbi:hypothetical protein DY000_02015066 [Brassica cretica]|uniref:Uncharacterized protein n=1 Tax=Brassica cretica TaxID=69181 RepID=A0ABQ7CNN0_BRACR|nr:hypothetical protein DY000_02015066 [Brassica cretica]